MGFGKTKTVNKKVNCGMINDFKTEMLPIVVRCLSFHLFMSICN